jgi:hypothetical protein
VLEGPHRAETYPIERDGLDDAVVAIGRAGGARTAFMVGADESAP